MVGLLWINDWSVGYKVSVDDNHMLFLKLSFLVRNVVRAPNYQLIQNNVYYY